MSPRYWQLWKHPIRKYLWSYLRAVRTLPNRFYHKADMIECSRVNTA